MDSGYTTEVDETITETIEEYEMPLIEKEEVLRITALELSVKFAAAISTPDAAMSVDQMVLIADMFVAYIKGESHGEG